MIGEYLGGTLVEVPWECPRRDGSRQLVTRALGLSELLLGQGKSVKGISRGGRKAARRKSATQTP